MTDAPELSPATAKVDPETLVLRGSPGRVVRFRRGAIIAIAAVGSTALVGTAWLALKPATFRIVASDADRGDILSKPTDDALGTAPRTYGDVPQLGPPLPGDLGKPILDRQRAVAAPAIPSTADATAQAIETERQRLAAERMAARQSGVMMQLGSAARPAGDTPAPASDPGGVAASPPSRLALDPERDPNGQQRKVDFVAAQNGGAGISAHRVTGPASPWTLTAGSVIAASLITGLRSDLPGLVTAQVTERVFDSATGRTLLIPQGARLIGTYDSVIAFGQRRALIVWQRIVLPDGRSLTLDNVPATDPSGYAGLADQVDFHTWSLIKGVALSTLLGVGSTLTFSGESDLVQAIRESTQQNGARAGEQLTSRNLQVQPTITIRPGAPVRLVVHRDLVLAPWHSEGN